MIEFRIRIEGTAPLLMHSARMANPLEPSAKALKKISGKRTKTDDDYMEMARLEHSGSLYFVPGVGPYMPGENIARCLLDAARVTKQGVKLTRGVVITTDENPLAYKGPRTAEGLWDDENFRRMASVKVGMARVMRCRPMFRQWSTEADGIIDTSVLGFDDLADIVATAGAMIGLGDWRPRHGRFHGELSKVAA